MAAPVSGFKSSTMLFLYQLNVKKREIRPIKDEGKWNKQIIK